MDGRAGLLGRRFVGTKYGVGLVDEILRVCYGTAVIYIR